MMELIAKGDTPQETALQLGMTIGTVNTYLKRVYPKLGVNTIRDAALAFQGFRALPDHSQEQLARTLFSKLAGWDMETKRAIAARVLGMIDNDKFEERRDLLRRLKTVTLVPAIDLEGAILTQPGESLVETVAAAREEAHPFDVCGVSSGAF